MKKQTRSAQRPKKKTFTFQNQPADINWSGCKDCGGDELVIKGNVATHTCMNKTKTFDWEIAKQIHGREMVAFLKRVYQTSIGEDEFVAQFQKVPRPLGLSKLGRRAPCRGRAVYRNLRDNFDFFTKTEIVRGYNAIADVPPPPHPNEY